MNIEHLKLFTRIAATQNISLAGKEQGLSAAVSSSYIKKLEENVGVRLVHRTTRQVSLTEEGQSFLPYALEILESIQAARSSVGSEHVLPQGKLRITAPASFGRMHLVPALEAFLKTYPDLRIEMHLSDRIVDLVEGGFDLAIRDSALQDSTYFARKLAPDNRIVCASPDYLKHYGEPQTPNELANHNCVSLMGLETWAFQTAKGPQSIKTKNRFCTDNGEAVRDASVHGLGITISSTWCCYQQIQRGELIQILKNYPLASDVAIWAVYPSSRLIAPKVKVFIDYLLNYFTDTPYWEQNLSKPHL